MSFIAAFLWYLIAFALGALVAWVAASRMIPARSRDEAVRDLAAHADRRAS